MDTPTYDCKDYEKVPLIDATATMDDEGNVTVFCVNRDMQEDFNLTVDLRDFGKLRVEEHILLKHADVNAVNTEEQPFNVAPTQGPGGKVDGGMAEIHIPALSWNVIRLVKA